MSSYAETMRFIHTGSAEQRDAVARDLLELEAIEQDLDDHARAGRCTQCGDPIDGGEYDVCVGCQE